MKEEINPEKEKNFGKIKLENLKDFNKSREYVRALLHKSFGIEKGSKIFIECIEENESNKSSPKGLGDEDGVIQTIQSTS